MTRSLAIETGRPAFDSPLELTRPLLADRAALDRRIDAIYASGWVTNDGVNLKELESAVARLHQVEHCIVVCNATIGLQIAARALELEGEVIVPSFTFVATAHALAWIGLTPVFCDVDERSMTIDPVRAESLVTSRTSAILGVHLFGQSAAIERLDDLAARRGIKVFHDAAHAFGARRGGHPFGGFGACEVFSFHATKIFSTYEGGAIMTNDAALAARCRLLRNFGFQGYDRVEALGINAKLGEIAAAQGIETLPLIEDRLRINRELFLTYQRLLVGIPGMALQSSPPEIESNHHYLVVRIDREDFGLSRDALYRLLWTENIRARRYFFPGSHRMEPYRSDPDNSALELPVTERLLGEVLCLPMGHAIDAEKIEIVVEIIGAAHQKAVLVRDWHRREYPEDAV